MNFRAHWQFYKTISPFIAGIAVLSSFYVGFIWGFLIFSTIGLLIGFLGFKTFYNDQFYFYYNLGLTKWKLFKVSFLINLLIGIPVFSILIIFIFFIFGKLQIT